jgi:hypothetical protein
VSIITSIWLPFYYIISAIPGKGMASMGVDMNYISPMMTIEVVENTP